MENKNYIKLAEYILSFDNIDINNFTDFLKDYLKFKDIKTHIVSSQYSNLLLCNYDIDRSNEQHYEFANGCNIKDNAEIKAKIYWKYNNKYYICKFNKYYEYYCHGNSGGVEHCNVTTQNAEILDFESNKEIKKGFIDENIIKIIYQISDFICVSEYDDINISDYYTEINDNNLYDFLKNKF